FRLPSGVLESQELWLKLSELFAPVAREKNFTRFNIPFKCIGTDISTGEAVVLDSGEIVTALRASMAIPSLFSAIEYKGKKLVDGGIVRNFPVRDVREMGADIVIGSNVASGLFPANKKLNAFQILFQVAFFREAEDRKTEVPLCNIYVPIKLEDYNMGSFNQASEIMEIGMKEGRKLYPQFKKLVDSLDAIYGKEVFVKNRLPVQNAGIISSYAVNGLKNTTQPFFIHTMNLLTGRSYNAEELSKMVRTAAGTRYYNRISYSLVPIEDGTNKIIFDVSENPLTFAKFGIHYNEFSDISLIGNLTVRNLVFPDSRDLFTLNLGENLRIRAEHLQYLGRLKNMAFITLLQAERLNMTSYRNFRTQGLYRQNYVKVEGRLQYSTRKNLSLSLGSRFEYVRYDPSISPDSAYKGTNNFGSFFLGLYYNSLDRTLFPNTGRKISIEPSFILTQNPSIQFIKDGLPYSNPDSTGLSKTAYPRFQFNLESYSPLGKRSVLFVTTQTGINFNYHNHLLNEFAVGGLNTLFRNQILFAGLKEGSFYSASVAAVQLGLRHQLGNNMYVSGRANALLANFIGENYSFYKSPDFLSGYSMTMAYNFAIGPMEFSFMYSDQSKKVRTYVNIGIPF
ncbi:MAG: patatin-like phospholipase family protein, partial [Chitinophagaceae bacterium]